MSHPCLSCGACCAAYLVAFHWLEAEADGFATPAELTEPLGPHRLAMRGTHASQPRCTALQGRIGERVGCSIYAQRPGPCRELVPAWEHGLPSPQCDRARARHGLAPLTAAAWPESAALPLSGIDPISVSLPIADPLASAVAAVDLDQQFAATDLGMQQQPLN